jgi:hypothetical protein
MKSQIRKLERLLGVKEEESFRPLTLKSTVISIFIVYLACAGFCIGILMAEKTHNYFKGYKFKLKSWILKG